MRVKDTSFDINKFIELIKVRRPIYALNDKEHHNRLIVDALWTEVSDEMQRSVIECKTKWHQLRNNYARELRREKIYSRRSIWYLRKPLDFLQNHIVQTKPRKKYFDNKIPGLETLNKYADQNVEKIEAADTNEPEETCEETVAYDEYSTYEENSNEIEAYDQNEMILPSSRRYSRENSEIMKIEKVEGRDDSNKCQINNADMSFFQSLFPDMQRLSARRKRKFKETVLVSLNRLMDEEEEEENSNGYHLSYETVNQQ